MGKRGRPTLASQGKSRKTAAQSSKEYYQRKKAIARKRERAARKYWLARFLLDRRGSHIEIGRKALEQTLKESAWAVTDDDPLK
jgi:hypothetical protein